MLRDESFHPLEFDHHLFFNKDSRNPLPSSWVTSNAHPIIEPVSFLCSSFSSCLSCLSCLSMFPNAANRFNGTWSLLPKGHKDPLFHSRMIVTAGRGPGLLETSSPKPSRSCRQPCRKFWFALASTGRDPPTFRFSLSKSFAERRVRQYGWGKNSLERVFYRIPCVALASTEVRAEICP